MSWAGKLVKHTDGRTGVIRDDYTGYLHRALTLQCADGSTAYVQLNSDGQDSGETGWSWYCADLDPGLETSKWLLLGDHNPPTETLKKAEEAKFKSSIRPN